MENNLVAIHSFWSKPFINNRWGVKDQWRKNIFSYALSALYIKRIFGSVTLVCDEGGAELLEVIGYDKIDTSLNELKDVNEKFWAYGKFKALSLFNETVVHIDGDVLLKSNDEKYLQNVFDSNWDMIVQMKEVGDAFKNTYSEMLPVVSSVTGIYYELYNYAFNCGVLGFKDVEFKELVCNTFFESIEKCNQNMEAIYQISGKYEVNCALEQSLVTYMAENHNKHVKEILPMSEISSIGLEGLSNNVGYAHLWGQSKYSDYWISRLKKRLLELDKDLYKRVVNQYEKYSI